jgi:hypothetical protein
MAAEERAVCTASITGIDGRGTIRCTLPAGPHDDPDCGAFHQAPAEYAGGLTLWLDTATGATPAN